MKQTIRLTLGLLALLVLSLTSCGPDPRKEAEAARIRSEANTQAANEAQARKHLETMNQLDEQERAAEIARIEAVQAKRIAALNTMWTTFKVFGSLGLAVTLLALAVSISRASYGISVAMVSRAELSASLIPLDRMTRQYPQLYKLVNNVPTLADPNGSTRQLTQPHEADKQLVTSNGLVQLYGAAFQEAAKSNDPAGLGMARLPVVHTVQDGLYIGETYIENPIPLPEQTS